MFYEGKVLGFANSGIPECTIVRIMSPDGSYQEVLCDIETAEQLKHHLNKAIRYTLDEKFQFEMTWFEPIGEVYDEEEEVTPEGLVNCYMGDADELILAGFRHLPTLFVYGEKGRTRIGIKDAPGDIDAFTGSMLIAGSKAAHVVPYCVILLMFVYEPQAYVAAAQRWSDKYTVSVGIPFTEVGGQIVLGEPEEIIPWDKLIPLFQAFWLN